MIIIFFLINLYIIPQPILSISQKDESFANQNIFMNNTSPILITGFKPFHIYPINPSEIIANQMNYSTIEGIPVLTWVLPIDFEKSPHIIQDLIKTYDPQIILCLGLAPNATTIRVETLATNLQFDPYVPNPYLSLRLINRSGHFLIPATIKVLKTYNELQKNNIPSTISFSAGWYLCNNVFYKTIEYLQNKQSSIPMGFIHIPQFKEDNPNGLEQEQIIEAITIIVRSNLETFA